MSVAPVKFENLFRNEFGLNEEEFQYLFRHFDKKFVDKKQHLLREGEVCRQKVYIVSGCTRSYVVDYLGKEHVQFFAFDDWWVGDIESYHTQQPAKTNVQALEDCELLVAPRDDFDRLEREIPQLSQWYTVKLLKAQFASINRLIDAKTKSPQERYEALLLKHPDILQRVPLQQIAAYLDIEPQSFSRMRSRMVQQRRQSNAACTTHLV